jgi:hypothetical protein
VHIARSHDGRRFETIAVLDKDEVGAESLERPALVTRPEGGWRLYLSGATPGTLHWWVKAIDADQPDAFDPSRARMTLPGDARTAVKDPVVVTSGGQWHLWACCHPLPDPAEADRMETRYATSTDGLDWRWHRVALAGREGRWDARGARITAVVLGEPDAVAYYDGRATADENWEERTGFAVGGADGAFGSITDDPVGADVEGGGAVRYVSVVTLPDGGHRLYYEARRADGAHDLRTEQTSRSGPTSGASHQASTTDQGDAGRRSATRSPQSPVAPAGPAVDLSCGLPLVSFAWPSFPSSARVMR